MKFSRPIPGHVLRGAQIRDNVWELMLRVSKSKNIKSVGVNLMRA